MICMRLKNCIKKLHESYINYSFLHYQKNFVLPNIYIFLEISIIKINLSKDLCLPLTIY